MDEQNEKNLNLFEQFMNKIIGKTDKVVNILRQQDEDEKYKRELERMLNDKNRR